MARRYRGTGRYPAPDTRFPGCLRSKSSGPKRGKDRELHSGDKQGRTPPHHPQLGWSLLVSSQSALGTGQLKRSLGTADTRKACVVSPPEDSV